MYVSYDKCSCENDVGSQVDCLFSSTMHIHRNIGGTLIWWIAKNLSFADLILAVPIPKPSISQIKNLLNLSAILEIYHTYICLQLTVFQG